MEIEQLQQAAAPAAEPVLHKDAAPQQQTMEQTEAEAASEPLTGSDMLVQDDDEDDVDWDSLLDTTKCQRAQRDAG
jgi:hypothetical protein